MFAWESWMLQQRTICFSTLYSACFWNCEHYSFVDPKFTLGEYYNEHAVFNQTGFYRLNSNEGYMKSQARLASLTEL